MHGATIKKKTIISLNSTSDHEFNKQSDWFANIVRCDTQHNSRTTVFDHGIWSSTLHNQLSLMFFLHVSTSARSSSGRYIQRQTSTANSVKRARTELKPYILLIKIIKNTGLFEMIVGVLTTCHTQYTWDRTICIFFYLIEQHSKLLLHTLQVLYMFTLCGSTNINTIIDFVPNCL